MQTISTPDKLPADVRQKIDAAIPRQAMVKPERPRKLLILDLCVNGGYYHASIPDGNLALELIGKYTGAYVPTFSNDLDNLKYPKIKEYDAVFLNSYHFLPTGPYSREKLHILLSLDPAKTEQSANRYTIRPDNDYGMVWISSYGKGRVFNCALGHRPEFYETANMEQLLLAATQFVLGDLKADTTPSAQLAKK